MTDEVETDRVREAKHQIPLSRGCRCSSPMFTVARCWLAGGKRPGRWGNFGRWRIVRRAINIAILSAIHGREGEVAGEATREALGLGVKDAATRKTAREDSSYMCGMEFDGAAMGRSKLAARKPRMAARTCNGRGSSSEVDGAGAGGKMLDQSPGSHSCAW